VESGSLSTAKTEVGNEITLTGTLNRYQSEGVTDVLRRDCLSQRLGESQAYADGGTTTWKVELLVAIKRHERVKDYVMMEYYPLAQTGRKVFKLQKQIYPLVVANEQKFALFNDS